MRESIKNKHVFILKDVNQATQKKVTLDASRDYKLNGKDATNQGTEYIAINTSLYLTQKGITKYIEINKKR